MQNDFWGIFHAWPPFCRKRPFYTQKTSSKCPSGKWIKQTPTPQFWGGCCSEKVISVFVFGRSKSHFRAPENAQKYPCVFFHIDTTYIKGEQKSENYLIFWCILLFIHCDIMQPFHILAENKWMYHEFSYLTAKALI